jgi:hypothetical protein
LQCFSVVVIITIVVLEESKSGWVAVARRRMIRSREDIAYANRIVIKAGTTVVSTPDGFPSLQRMANIVEHVVLLSVVMRVIYWVYFMC